MKVITKAIYQMHADGMDLIEEECIDYDGPIAQALGGRSSTAQTTESTQTIDTTSVGLSDIEGIGVAGGRDVEFNLSTSDFGAIQGAQNIADRSFDFAGEFSGEAFDFANSISRQSGNIAQQAIATSAGAIKTAGEATRSDTSQTLVQIAKFAAAALAVFFIAQTFKRA